MFDEENMEFMEFIRFFGEIIRISALFIGGAMSFFVGVKLGFTNPIFWIGLLVLAIICFRELVKDNFPQNPIKDKKITKISAEQN
jgi:hypothetical protein